jgi:hypothetical protein
MLENRYTYIYAALLGRYIYIAGMGWQHWKGSAGKKDI